MTSYLYIKTHLKTGLKYLGQTTKDPFKYRGSGKYWKRHIKIHGHDVSTQILLATEDANELKETGLFFSKMFDVVRSKQWANLMEESGNGISPEFSSELQRKRIKEGNLPQVFTSEKTRQYNLERSRNGTHPFLGGTYTKELNKRMLEQGTHPFTDINKMAKNREVVKQTQQRLSLEGKHNFKGKIPVIDKSGNVSIITKDEYIRQKTLYQNPQDWPYVSTASNEAKRRKHENT